jgi:hypothetical protein
MEKTGKAEPNTAICGIQLPSITVDIELLDIYSRLTLNMVSKE